MKNLPMFTTEYGVASLTLEKIPYTHQAYIVIQDTCDPGKLLKDCADFCCAAGAEQVYATGNFIPKEYPLYTEIIVMSRRLQDIPETVAELVPVDNETLSCWREIYNEKMRNVPNAAFLSIRDSEKVLNGNAYFIYKEDKMLGIGQIGENTINAVAAVAPGGGKDTVLALCGAIRADSVFLEVARNNQPAIKLYSGLGFSEISTISKWYKIK